MYEIITFFHVLYGMRLSKEKTFVNFTVIQHVYLSMKVFSTNICSVVGSGWREQASNELCPPIP